jgi:ABC-type glycerol-3-phosphate transport system substrate-binding protein
MKRIPLRYLSFLLLAFILFQGFVTAQDVVELRMWFGRQDFIPADAFELFHEQHPNIRVTWDVIPLEEAPTEFIRNFRAGRAPDIWQVGADRLGSLAPQGLMYDMTEYFERWQEEDPDGYNDLAPVAFGIASYDGVPHGLGLHVGPYWYVYRKDLFEEAGIAVPQTWDEVLEAGRQLRTADRIGFSLIGSRAHDPMWFQAKFMSMGGEWVNGIPQLDSEAGIYLLNFYQTLARDNIIHPETLSWNSGDMRAAFIGGNAAQAPIGDNIFTTINSSLTWDEEWAATPLPPRPGAEDMNRQMAPSWPYFVSASTEHPYEVSLVLRYLAQADIVKEIALRYQPTTVGSVMDDPEYSTAKPWAPQFAEPFANLVPLPAHPRQPQIYEILLDAMQDALQNPDADTAAMAARYQASLNALQ